MRLFNALFPTLEVLKTKILSSPNIFGPLTKRDQKETFRKRLDSQIMAIFQTGVLFWVPDI